MAHDYLLLDRWFRARNPVILRRPTGHDALQKSVQGAPRGRAPGVGHSGASCDVPRRTPPMTMGCEGAPAVVRGRPMVPGTRLPRAQLVPSHTTTRSLQTRDTRCLRSRCKIPANLPYMPRRESPRGSRIMIPESLPAACRQCSGDHAPVVTGTQGSIQNTCQNRSQATLGLNGTRKNNRFEMLNLRRENSVSRWISK